MPADPDTARALRALLHSGWPGIRAVVVGDAMLDRYLQGAVDRISPEAPVPVLRKAGESSRAGGAANVALNLASLGVDTTLVSAVGDDPAGAELADVLARAGLGRDGLIRVDGRRSTTKTRLMTGHQQLLRFDDEETEPLDAAIGDRIIALVDRSLSVTANALILSDYRKGLLTEDVCRACIDLARDRGIPVIVDPKGADYERYAGADVVTPNLAELELATEADRHDLDGLIDAGRSLAEALGIGAVVLTRGGDGLTLIERDRVVHSPARARQVFDVTGAGDTVTATLAAARGAGLRWPESLQLANLAAGLVVQRIGAVSVGLRDLQDALDDRDSALRAPVHDRDDLAELVADWRHAGDRIVFTNGCFDVLHRGHISSLAAAAREGDRLVVAVNSDRSVRALKGSGRPINAEGDRAAVVAALKAVDAVTIFDEETPLALIQSLKPDVLVKGADYAGKPIVGAREVEAWGGKVVLTPLVEGASSTRLIESGLG